MQEYKFTEMEDGEHKQKQTCVTAPARCETLADPSSKYERLTARQIKNGTTTEYKHAQTQAHRTLGHEHICT